uniref:Uncharacterized protein n=1 Tax=Romanomermis culicivorax TaxID=13658 RepID=A0A915JHL9_ROMCU
MCFDRAQRELSIDTNFMPTLHQKLRLDHTLNRELEKRKPPEQKILQFVKNQYEKFTSKKNLKHQNNGKTSEKKQIK